MKMATWTTPSAACSARPPCVESTARVMMRGRKKNSPIPRASVIVSMMAMPPLPSSTPSSEAERFAERTSQRVPVTSVS